jgi:ABC-type phosphate transport system ATPase subunit
MTSAAPVLNGQALPQHELAPRQVFVVSARHVMMSASSSTNVARVSDKTAFLMGGQIIEFSKTTDFFTNPSSKITEDYITGRFG